MLDEVAPNLVVRAQRSEEVRKEFADTLVPQIEPLLKDRRVCLYTTGSYGRQEAWVDDSGKSGSDIDLFILETAIDDEDTLSGLTKIRLQALLIDTAEKFGFPEFDGDGRFLEVHRLDEMKDEIGSEKEDAKNFFTARLLLLLESQPLAMEDEYTHALSLFAGEYLRDARGREDSFRPAFIMNDISRFWRTLCLNYEHRRYNARSDDDPAKGRLKNLKLGFSRMLTCHSGLLHLASTYRINGTVRTDDVLDLASQTPVKRLVNIAERHTELTTDVGDVVANYDWFLATLGRDKSEAYKLLRTDAGHNDANERQLAFHLGLVRIYKHLIADTELERFALA